MVRKAFHLAVGSLVPLSGLGLPRGVFLPLLGAATLFSLIFDLTRRRYPSLNRWFLVQLIGLKTREQQGLNGASYLLLAALILFLALEAKLAALALFFLTIGDPMAAIVGRRWGRHRIKGKSVEGSLAFLISALLLGLALGRAWGFSSWVVAAGATVAALLELLPLPGDDNLRVPLGAALALYLLSQA